MSPDTRDKIKEEVDKTLAVLDNIENIEGNPFLYTRIIANLKSKPASIQSRIQSVLTSPRIALIITLIILNFISAALFLSKTNTVSSNEISFVGSLTDDYYLTTDNDIITNLNENE